VAALQAAFVVGWYYRGESERGSALSSALFSPTSVLSFVTAAGTFYKFYVSHILQLLRLFSLYPSLPSSFPLLLPCPAHPPFLLPQRPQSSIPSEGRQQDTPSRSLAGKGQGQLMWLCVYTEREGAHAW